VVEIMTRKVMIFVNQVLPYSQTFVLEQARALRRYAPVFVGCRKEDGLQVPGEITTVINGGNFGGRLRELPFKVFGIIPPAFKALTAPALIHAHFGPNGVLAIALARYWGVPLVVTFHGYDATITGKQDINGFVHHRYRWQYKQLFTAATSLICVSEFVRDCLLSQGFPKEKLVVHQIGVDIERFAPEPACKRSKAVLCVARLIPLKGIDHLISAMRVVQASHPSAALWIVGEGPMHESLQEAASGLNIHFLGRLSQSDVSALMRRARVCCLPSVAQPSGQTEGFGIVLIEAQAAGVPVVAFDHGGPREALRDGETGFLAPFGDDAALAERIERLLSDDSLWAMMSNNAVQFARTKFDLHRQTAKLEKLYDAAIARGVPCG
jgi:glycosyltransferase involved in cell wall biosynthesis